MNAPFPVLGLTGGIATGKSHVAGLLAGLGWTVIDADRAARAVVEPGSEGLAALVDLFGRGLLTPQGSLDRKALAASIFQSPEARQRLEACLHPRIEAWMMDELGQLPAETLGVVLDAALWVERSKGHHFDALWVVDAPEAIRIQRLAERDGLTEAEARARFSAQSTFAEKALHADLVILNDGQDLLPSLSAAERALRGQWTSLRARRWPKAVPPPFPIEELRELLGLLLARGGEYAEIFIERKRATGLGMEDRRLEELQQTESFGVGLRLVDGEGTRFADLIAPSLAELQEAARILSSPGRGSAHPIPPLAVSRFPTPSPVEKDPQTVPLEAKVALIKHAEDLTRQACEACHSGDFQQVRVHYADASQQVWIARAELKGASLEAALTDDLRVQGVLRVEVTLGSEARLCTGYQALGGSFGFEGFTPEALAQTTKEAVRLAMHDLEALPAPAGTFPVILSSRAGGTMIHEACGHGLEADLALAGMSAYSGLLGQKVAEEGVTLVDDGTLPGLRGSAAMDDEGHPTTRVVLIEKGILKGYLHSRRTARQMGLEPTGNGRRENYQHQPIPRMRNTYLAPGSETPEGILEKMEEGLLVKQMGGGQVDTVTGNFVFQVTEGYWVQGGRVHHPVRNATLSGCGPALLRELRHLGNDLRHFDLGTCGKDGQGVPVSDAQPTLLCPSLVVGGTGAALPGIL